MRKMVNISKMYVFRVEVTGDTYVKLYRICATDTLDIDDPAFMDELRKIIPLDTVNGETITRVTYDDCYSSLHGCEVITCK